MSRGRFPGFVGFLRQAIRGRWARPRRNSRRGLEQLEGRERARLASTGDHHFPLRTDHRRSSRSRPTTEVGPRRQGSLEAREGLEAARSMGRLGAIGHGFVLEGSVERPDAEVHPRSHWAIWCQLIGTNARSDAAEGSPALPRHRRIGTRAGRGKFVPIGINIDYTPPRSSRRGNSILNWEGFPPCCWRLRAAWGAAGGSAAPGRIRHVRPFFDFPAIFPAPSRISGRPASAHHETLP